MQQIYAMKSKPKRLGLAVFFALSGVLFALVSCQSNHGNGNFSEALISELRLYGANLTTTNGLPELRGDWKLKKDENGFEFVTTGVPYENIESLLIQAFGPTSDTIAYSSPRYRLFKATTAGVGLLIVDRTNDVVINCLRGTTNGHIFQ